MHVFMNGIIIVDEVVDNYCNKTFALQLKFKISTLVKRKKKWKPLFPLIKIRKKSPFWIEDGLII